jgi:hypothetical protein
VLNEASADLSILLGTSDGTFVEQSVRPLAGNVPTGLAAADIDSDGRQDLVVGNDFGDLLVLLGNGDGTFQPYRRADGRVALAAIDLDDDELDDFFFANQSADTVEVQYSQGTSAFRQLRSDGLLAPAAVATADLDLDDLRDLIVANSGANTVLVYRGLAGGQFAPARSFFAGTNPVSVTVHELSGDALPDLAIANEGSNDVTVLLGQSLAAGWTLAPGPRLQAGGGPVQTLVRDETRDGVPDIVVTNKQSSDVYLLAGLGLGFFDDRNPIIRPTGEQPAQILTLPDGGLATINEGANNVTFFADLFSQLGQTFSSGGQGPVAGITGDFNGDRFSDLLVAHQGSGVIRMLAGGPDGFSLSGSFSHTDLPHPAALASIFRNGKFEIYAVNEHGSQAVLAAIIDPDVPRPTPSPLPLPSLLLVLAPGFELAISVLTAETPIAVVPAGSATHSDETAGGEVPAELEEGAGSQSVDPEKGDEEGGSGESDEDSARTDAAILEMLMGMPDALALRPPKLARDEIDEEPTGANADAASGAGWYDSALGWIWAVDWSGVAELLPLPPCLDIVADTALAALREYFGLLESAPAADKADLTRGTSLSAAESATDEVIADQSWTVDIWLAATFFAGLASAPCRCEAGLGKRSQFRPRRARFHRRPRPSC